MSALLTLSVVGLALACSADGSGEAGNDGTSDTSSGESGTGTDGTGTGTGTGTEGTDTGTTDASTTGTTGTTDATSTSTGDTSTDSSTDTTGGGACADMPDCGDCFACAKDDATLCADAKAACEADQDCSALAACVAKCPPVGDKDFEQCHDDCVDGMPGENLFKNLGACLACDTCGCDPQDHPEC